jgi:hypothetical protein
MSKLQVYELNSTSLTVLNDRETSAVLGGFSFTQISRSYNTQVGVNLSSISQGAGGGYYYGGGGSNYASVGQSVYNQIG